MAVPEDYGADGNAQTRFGAGERNVGEE